MCCFLWEIGPTECCCADRAVCRVAMAGRRVSGSGVSSIVRYGIVWVISLCTRTTQVQRSGWEKKKSDKAQTMKFMQHHRCHQQPLTGGISYQIGWQSGTSHSDWRLVCRRESTYRPPTMAGTKEPWKSSPMKSGLWTRHKTLSWQRWTTKLHINI